MKPPIILAITQTILGLTIGVVCLFAQAEKCPTEFTFSHNGSNFKVYINPGPEQIRGHSLTMVGSILGFIVYGGGIAQLVYVARSNRKYSSSEE